MTSAIERAVAAVGPEPYYEHEGITIYHGDCRELIPRLGLCADLTLTDPPYGVGRRYGPNYDDSRARYWDWFLPALALVKSAASVVTVHHLLFAMKHITDWDWVIAWHKPYGAGVRIGNSPILPHWEPILVWGIHSLGTKPGVLPDWLSHNPERSPRPHNGKSPRNADDEQGTGHPLPKPVALERKLISVLSHEGALVFDPFMGSGTTLRAAKDLGRRAIGIEIEERYCEIAAKRLAQEVMAL